MKTEKILENLYKTEELEENSTIGNFPIVQNEGGRDVKRGVKLYNLDAILSVGNNRGNNRDSA